MSDYPIVSPDSVTNGYNTVDIKLKGFFGKSEIDGLMFVGHTGFDVIDKVCVQPKLSWALALKNFKLTTYELNKLRV